jgi:DNA-binding response OmpR family regulator
MKILKMLLDGLPHRRDEIRDLLDHDCQDSLNALQVHISNLRKLLRLQGQDIEYEYHHKDHWYRLVNTLTSPYKK